MPHHPHEAPEDRSPRAGDGAEDLGRDVERLPLPAIVRSDPGTTPTVETPARLIERERPGLLGRIGNEFQAMGKLADDPGGDWRMAMIPLYHDERVDRIRLYQRNARNKNEDSDDGKRFILDFDLSKLGHIQIDGLVKSDTSKVDIIIRSEKSLGQNAQMEIAQIYNEAAELTGMGGGIAFQSSPGNFIQFPSTAENTDHDGLIV